MAVKAAGNNQQVEQVAMVYSYFHINNYYRHLPQDYSYKLQDSCNLQLDRYSVSNLPWS